MKLMKKMFAFILVMCMVLSLCACGGNEEPEQDVQNDVVDEEQQEVEDQTSESETEAEDETKEEVATFLVKVVDEGNNPVQGVMVQICKDSCIPAMTDAEGVATFNVEIEDGHKLSVMSCPEGYEYDGEAEVPLESGATEYTLTLKGVK